MVMRFEGVSVIQIRCLPFHKISLPNSSSFFGLVQYSISPPGFVAEEKVGGGGKNDLGVDPHEWFDSPNRYAPVERRAELDEELDLAPCEYEPPSDDDWFGSKKEEKEETMHQKMYEMATARYNPFGLGGSENCDSDISCNKLGGSEERIQEFTPENDPFGGY